MPILGLWRGRLILRMQADAASMEHSPVYETRGKSAPDYEDVVIGSSPLMILQAMYLARRGRHVCVLERSDDLGGNWQMATLESGDKVEIACHLIEVFPGVYDLLQEYSGVPFVALDAQPIRITRRGLKVAYHSRVLMLASGARLVLGWMRAHLDVLRGAAPDRNSVLNFRHKLSSYIEYQLPAFFGALTMKGPRDGFADFMTQLCARAVEEGVVFTNMDVTEMTLDPEKHWHIRDATDHVLLAHNVHVTTSTNLQKIAPGHITAGSKRVVHRMSVVVDVPSEEVFVSHTYVSFWADPKIARIARIDHPGPALPNLRFLVEFHGPDLDGLGDWQAVVRDRMVHAGIIKHDTHLVIAGQVDCTYTANVDQFPSGQVDHNLWGYYSTGNLAAGLVAWHKSQQRESQI
jgi:hypothetical protein